MASGGRPEVPKGPKGLKKLLQRFRRARPVVVEEVQEIVQQVNPAALAGGGQVTSVMAAGFLLLALVVLLLWKTVSSKADDPEADGTTPKSEKAVRHDAEAEKLARWTAEVKQLEARLLPAYTNAIHPTSMSGKEYKHVPRVTLAKNNSAKITVPHVSEQEHWIQYIWVKDAAGGVVAVKKFKPGEAAELEFDVPATAKTITAYECCNQHKMWASIPFMV